jgi:hypothetical protein
MMIFMREEYREIHARGTGVSAAIRQLATPAAVARERTVMRCRDKSPSLLARMRVFPVKTSSLCPMQAVPFAPHGAMEK